MRDRTSALRQKREGYWNYPRAGEFEHSFNCIRQLEHISWAKPLTAKAKPSIALLEWLQENRDKQHNLEWLDKWHQLEQLRPTLFEVRYAHDIHHMGITPVYEQKTIGDSSVDFGVQFNGSTFLNELVSTLQSDAVTGATEHISENAKTVTSNDAEELLKIQGKIVRKVAKRELIGKTGNFVPIKFPMPIVGGPTYNVIIADTYGFSGGEHIEAEDMFQLVFGAEQFLEQGGNEVWAYGVAGDWLAGLFDNKKPGEEAKIFRERVHLLGLVSERKFGTGELMRQTHLYRNPYLFQDGKMAAEKFPFKGIVLP